MQDQSSHKWCVTVAVSLLTVPLPRQMAISWLASNIKKGSRLLGFSPNRCHQGHRLHNLALDGAIQYLYAVSASVKEAPRRMSRGTNYILQYLQMPSEKPLSLVLASTSTSVGFFTRSMFLRCLTCKSFWSGQGHLVCGGGITGWLWPSLIQHIIVVCAFSHYHSPWLSTWV